MKYIETLFWKTAIWIIHNGYGQKCETSDLDDFDIIRSHNDILDGSRCACCRANEIVDWIEDHIRLINWDWSK